MNNKNMTCRRDMIRQMLSQHHSLRLDTLARQLRVNAMTIRRDLIAMEKQGVLIRTHGGCVWHSPLAGEFSFVEKDRRAVAQKTAIAREALRLLKPGMAIFIDTGTTVLRFAQTIPAQLKLRVFTNNVRVAMELYSRENIEIVIYGGRMARNNPDLIGEEAVERIRLYPLDLAFLGADALDPDTGRFYASTPADAAILRAVIGQSENIVMLIDSSKIGKKSAALAGEIAKGMTLITDNGVAQADLKALRRTGAAICCVQVTDVSGITAARPLK